MFSRSNRPIKVVWGFMLENTYFMEFDAHNHRIIEDAYRQRKLRQTSHYITIQDSHLPAPARVYFGVIQVHLRMPGTRYYVKRRVLCPSPQRVASQPVPSLLPTPSSSTAISAVPNMSCAPATVATSLNCPPAITSMDPVISALFSDEAVWPQASRWPASIQPTQQVTPPETPLLDDPFLFFMHMQSGNTQPTNPFPFPFLNAADASGQSFGMPYPLEADALGYVNTIATPTVMSLHPC